MKVTVVTVPVSGEPTRQEVELEATGVSVAEALAAAGIPVENMQVSVNGKPVSDNDLHLANGAEIQLAEAKTVERTERASGS